MQNNRKRFLEDIILVKREYPDLLHHPIKDNFFRLEGDVPVYDTTGHLRDIFQIKVLYSSNYPKGFAKLFEIGNEIPVHVDWHKYSDSECCVCAKQEELIQQEKSISAFSFLREYGIPFLVNYLHKKEFGFYPNGEYEHGDNGSLQWYREKFPNSSISEIMEILKIVIFNKPFPKPYLKCICGSGKKFKKCHYKICSELRLLPQKILLQELKMLVRIKNTVLV